MKDIKWTDDLSVGVGLIDDQHKMLIQHLNNLSQAVEQNLGPVKITETLDFLTEYTDFHFSTEERHMASNGYPGLDVHRTKHEEFKTTLNNLVEDYNEEGATNPLAVSIDTLLVNWLFEHIKGVDVGFGTFLKNNGIVLGNEG
jgi:hemerythrin